jgi:hypothetical protein
VRTLIPAGLAIAALVGAAPKAENDPAHRLHAAATPPGAELVRSIPIGKPRRASAHAVLSLGPSRLGAIEPGATIRVYGEIQVSLTCAAQGLARCIGHSYDYSPTVAGRIILASGPRASPAALPLGSRKTIRCRAKPIANRNHHCVLVFDEALTVPAASAIPCSLRSCYLNLVIRATSRRASRGDRLVIGADERSGGVRRNKGRLAAVLIPRGVPPRVWRDRTMHVRHDELPERQDGGRRIVYSVRLPALRWGGAIAATARQSTDIDHLPYAAYVSDQLVLARSPGAVRPARPSPAADAGYLTAANGFNCTHGHSAYRSPCVARKAGALAIVRAPRRGRYYVNLVSRSKPKHSPGRPGDSARVLRRGFLDVTVYRP